MGYSAPHYVYISIVGTDSGFSVWRQENPIEKSNLHLLLTKLKKIILSALLSPQSGGLSRDFQSIHLLLWAFMTTPWWSEKDQSRARNMVIQGYTRLYMVIHSYKYMKVDDNFRRLGYLWCLFIGPRCPWGPIYTWQCLKLTERPFADLTDVTLAECSNTTYAIWWSTLKALQLAPSCGQICN